MFHNVLMYVIPHNTKWYIMEHLSEIFQTKGDIK